MSIPQEREHRIRAEKPPKGVFDTEYHSYARAKLPQSGKRYFAQRRNIFTSYLRGLKMKAAPLPGGGGGIFVDAGPYEGLGEFGNRHAQRA